MQKKWEGNVNRVHMNVLIIEDRRVEKIIVPANV